MTFFDGNYAPKSVNSKVFIPFALHETHGRRCALREALCNQEMVPGCRQHQRRPERPVRQSGRHKKPALWAISTPVCGGTLRRSEPQHGAAESARNREENQMGFRSSPVGK